ncbi:MAG: hypothetical protein ACK58N_12035, partial [Synechocystis sp.]
MRAKLLTLIAFQPYRKNTFKKVLTYLGEVSILINARLRAKANRSAPNLEKEIVLRDRNQTLVNSINE